VEDEDTNKTYALKRVSPLGSRETFANPWEDQASPVSPCGFPIKTMVNHGKPGYNEYQGGWEIRMVNAV